jgi:hypothetical protein
LKSFRCLVGLKLPPLVVATAIRDRMADLAPALEHVEVVSTVTRIDRADGAASLVNAWRVNPPLPQGLEGIVTREKLGWHDHAEWSADLAGCTWRIEPWFMGEAIDCRGATRFESAMGGRGTRAIFEGQLDIDPAALSSVPITWRAPASVAVEMLISAIIPKNFRRTAEAITALLESDRPPPV